MTEQGDGSHAKARDRGNKGLANAAGDGHRRAAGLQVEDTERLNHADDRAHEAENRRQCNETSEKRQTAFELGRFELCGTFNGNLDAAAIFCRMAGGCR